MDIASLISGPAGNDMLQQLAGLAQAHEAASVSTAVFDQVLEVQQQFATQLLQSMGIGENLDLFA